MYSICFKGQFTEKLEKIERIGINEIENIEKSSVDLPVV